jgi:DNA-binding transcriptional MerR regulator
LRHDGKTVDRGEDSQAFTRDANDARGHRSSMPLLPFKRELDSGLKTRAYTAHRERRKWKEGAERMSRESFRIGEIAAQAEVSIDTVRFYERRHLLPRAHRTQGGFRLFPPETIERIRFIRQAQDVGLSLDEIESILTVGGGANECRRISTLLTSKLTVLEARIKAMQDFRERLVQHLKACEGELSKQGTGTKCPVIKEITSSAQASPSPKRRRKDAS